MRHKGRPSSSSALDLSSGICRSSPSSPFPHSLPPSVSVSDRRSSFDSLADEPQLSPCEPPSLEVAESPLPSKGHCARTHYVLPTDRWPGKRKYSDDSPAHNSKRAKQLIRQRWADGLGSNDAILLTKADELSPVKPLKSDLATLSPSKMVPQNSTPNSTISDTTKPVKSKHVSKRSSSSRTPARQVADDNSSDVQLADRLSVSKPDLVKFPQSPQFCDTTKLDVSSDASAVKPVKSSSARVSSSTSRISANTAAASPSPRADNTVSPLLCGLSESNGRLPRRTSRSKDKPQRDPNSLPCKGNFDC